MRIGNGLMSVWVSRYDYFEESCECVYGAGKGKRGEWENVWGGN